MRFSTRSLTASASRLSSVSVVKIAQSGFCPVSSIFRYAIKYFGMSGSSPFLTAHHVDEAGEQVMSVVRARRRLRMVLDGEDRQLAVAHALGGPIVQIDVGLLEPDLRHGLGVDGEAVILRRDLDAARGQIAHRMIGAVVSELELVGAAAEGQSQDLVPEADRKSV